MHIVKKFHLGLLQCFSTFKKLLPRSSLFLDIFLFQIVLPYPLHEINTKNKKILLGRVFHTLPRPSFHPLGSDMALTENAWLILNEHIYIHGELIFKNFFLNETTYV